MKRKYLFLITITPLIFVLDQLTKWIIVHHIELGTRIAVIPGFFDIVHFRNTGAAFGMFAQLPQAIREPFFYAIAVIAVIVLSLMYRSFEAGERSLPIALSLVFGGIAGNMLDRIRLGSVIDFLSLHIGERVLQGSLLGMRFRFELEWPAFNVADSAITIAMFLIIISVIQRARKEACEGKAGFGSS